MDRPKGGETPVNLDNRLYVRIGPYLYAQLMAYCEKNGCKISKALRDALVFFLDSQE